MKKIVSFAAVTSLALLVGCGGSGREQRASSIIIDGSSTVFPLTAAVVEDFLIANPGIRIPVGFSGTGGGFKKFEIGETHINNASRPISASEAAAIRATGTDFIEIPVAFEGITIVVNPNNTWAETMTIDELRRLWEPGSQISRWNQIRPEWPDRPIRLFGAGVDSGTFDYFTEAVTGRAKASRTDFTSSEDDNTLVVGVTGDTDALGFFGFFYYIENQDRLRSVRIDGGGGPVAPSLETIRSGAYSPLSRPIFVYTTLRALEERPNIETFLEFYLDNVEEIAPEVGFVPLPENVYPLVRNRLRNRVTGSIFEGLETTVGVSLESALRNN